MNLDWRLSVDINSSEGYIPIGNSLKKVLKEFTEDHFSDLADLFPLRGAVKTEGCFAADWIAFRFSERAPGQVSLIDHFSAKDREALESKVLPFKVMSFEEMDSLLGSSWINHNTFTYVGPFDGQSMSSEHLLEHIEFWLNRHVVPRVVDINQKRVERVIPKGPSFDPMAVLKTIWILEDRDQKVQGTAVSIEGVGLVTCEHVVTENLEAFRPDAVTKKFPVTILKANKDVDLAILSIPVQISDSLAQTSADDLSNLEHLAVAGFPNYRPGDTGVFNPGMIVGFRTKSGVRRILTNARIVAGMSGGPAINSSGRVIGFAVTGADRMENAEEVEDHGIIPVDALKLI